MNRYIEVDRFGYNYTLPCRTCIEVKQIAYFEEGPDKDTNALIILVDGTKILVNHPYKDIKEAVSLMEIDSDFVKPIIHRVGTTFVKCTVGNSEKVLSDFSIDGSFIVEERKDESNK